MNTRSAIITLIAGLAFISLGIFWYTREQAYLSITTFDECVAAGYPILETYPEQCQTPDKRLLVNKKQIPSQTISTSTVTGKENLIYLDNLSSGQTVTSPVTISGSARGNWYFEASFGVEVVDGNGTRLTMQPAQAKSDWMTENFVPFSVTLTFPQPLTATGAIVFHKDNPSGIPLNDDELRIPVLFKQAERTVKLYYYNSALDKDSKGNILCSAKGLMPVTRTIKVSKTPLQDTLRLFLLGDISQEEKIEGVSSEFPLLGVSLASATITGSGLTTITLLDPNNKTSGGSCRVNILRAQLEATAKQFETVKKIIIVPETIFQP
ncbi:MAG: Gmad2 immunoglobulin-like domain-containing protein [Candidatus Paceibacterota bacterium]